VNPGTSEYFISFNRSATAAPLLILNFKVAHYAKKAVIVVNTSPGGFIVKKQQQNMLGVFVSSKYFTDDAPTFFS